MTVDEVNELKEQFANERVEANGQGQSARAPSLQIVEQGRNVTKNSSYVLHLGSFAAVRKRADSPPLNPHNDEENVLRTNLIVW